MSDSAWNKNLGFIGSLIVALVMPASIGMLIWQLSALATEDRVKSERNINHYEERSAELIKERCTAANPLPFEKCVEEIVSATHENQRQEADLMAQRAMAHWAYAMTVVSGMSLCLAAFGIWFVRGNLLEMQNQRLINQRAVDATLESNKIAQVQLRSNLICGGGSYRVWSSGIEIRFNLNNTGETPTNGGIIVASIHGQKISEVPMKTEERVGSIPSVDRGKGTHVSIHYPSELFTTDWFTVLSDTKIIFAVFARIEWWDIFGNSWESTAHLFPVNRSGSGGNLDCNLQSPAVLLKANETRPL